MPDPDFRRAAPRPTMEPVPQSSSHHSPSGHSPSDQHEHASSAPVAAGPGPGLGRRAALLPGIGLCAAGATVAVVVNRQWPTVSALLVAILLGAAVANLVRLPQATAPGIGFSAKHLLRTGIVLLGLQLVLGDIWALGWRMVLVVVAIVGLGIAGSMGFARLLGIARRQAVLVACGFSICGAAAVAGVDQVVDADEDEVATAIALVVLYGTLMIPLAPAGVHLLGLGTVAAGEWTGGCVHEVAQVVAAGAALGGASLKVAVVVKLARVLMLAPVTVALGWWVRRGSRASTQGGRAPLVPLFVVGFLAMVALASLHVLPHPLLAGAKLVQTALLAAAMFALGLGVKVAKLVQVGVRPFLLGLVSTAWVAAVALVGVAFAGGWRH